MGATGCAHGGGRCGGRAARPLGVATCAVHDCATRGSIAPLFYPQLLATKAMTSRPTGGLRVGKQTILVSAIAPELRLEKLCKKFCQCLTHCPSDTSPSFAQMFSQLIYSKSTIEKHLPALSSLFSLARLYEILYTSFSIQIAAFSMKGER